MEPFVVSARKYRPATFRSVIGQSHITETLKNAIARGQLAHAYLFTGPRGVGKTTCARIFAKAINCMNPTADHEACGECESCKAFNEGRSFSIHELDAASNNSVEDIRALTEKVRIPPQVGKYSVYIIDEVHMLSANAFNAFLKTLEEPPHYAVFILATTEKHKILPTILSRCQCYDFNRIRVEDTVQYLQYIAGNEGVTYDDEALHIIAQRADGGMRDALSMFDRVVSFCGAQLTGDKVAESLNVLDYNTYFAATDLILAGNYAELLTLFDGILRRGFEGQLFIAGLNGHMRDLLVCKNPQTAQLLEVTGNVAERYRAQAQACDVSFLFNAINLLTQTDTGYRQATNRRLHAELALIKLCGLGGLKKKDNAVGSPDATEEDALTLVAGVGKYPMPAIKVSGDAAVSVAPAPVSPAAAPAVAPSASVPVQAPVPDSKVEPAPVAAANPVAAAPVPQPAATASRPAVGRSITGVSITDLKAPSPAAAMPQAGNAAQEPMPPVRAMSPEEAERAVAAKYDELVRLWNERQRPRLATALTSKTIKGGEVTVTVPNEVLADEINQAKWEIERDLRNLTGAAVSVSVVVSEVQQEYKPVSTEDKLQYLVNLNPNILKLRDELDLTV
ncbi:MAG: DNA polymerase III subunit gamma/tau [Rikenellaceae bacterium]|nr:DNA polymerase III subunit gamma/tau [Rikenellaceae bacterium]